MSDIAERLKEPLEIELRDFEEYYNEEKIEAASEITRLREENRRLKSGYQKDLEHVISKIAKMAADSPELNMLNYTQDQVSDLNESMIEVCLFAEEVTGRICEGQSIKDLLARAALKGGE